MIIERTLLLDLHELLSNMVDDCSTSTMTIRLDSTGYSIEVSNQGKTDELTIQESIYTKPSDFVLGRTTVSTFPVN